MSSFKNKHIMTLINANLSTISLKCPEMNVVLDSSNHSKHMYCNTACTMINTRLQ